MLTLRSLLTVGAGALVLAACGDGNTTPAPAPTPTPAPVATAQSKFGSCFQTRFDAAPNTKATDPVPCPDLPAVSPTIKPNAI